MYGTQNPYSLSTMKFIRIFNSTVAEEFSPQLYENTKHDSNF